MPYPTSDYSGNLCIYDTPHNAIVYTVNYETCSDISFINKYTTSNGNNWWELRLDNGLCLNWDSPADGGIGNVLADSCIAGDPNELFYNHIAGQLINLAGNYYYGEDTWLQWRVCGTTNNGEAWCGIFVYPYLYKGWFEV